MELNTLSYILIGVIAVLLIWLIRLEHRLHKLAKGAKGESLEGVITSLHKKVAELASHRGQIDGHLQNLEKSVKKSIQGIETVRFNPFKDQGGNQSFSTAILSADGDGVVITGLYSRDKSSIYAKPVKQGQSEYELTIEEKQVINSAVK